MDRLGAVVDTRRRTLEFTEIFPGVRILLVKGQNGHLILDLCQDWTENSEPTKGEIIPRTFPSHLQQGTGSTEQNKGDVLPVELASMVGEHEECARDVQRHVHVVETRSETSCESIIEQFAAEELHSQGLASQAPEASPLAGRHGQGPGDPVGS